MNTSHTVAGVRVRFDQGWRLSLSDTDYSSIYGRPIVNSYFQSSDMTPLPPFQKDPINWIADDSQIRFVDPFTTKYGHCIASAKGFEKKRTRKGFLLVAHSGDRRADSLVRSGLNDTTELRVLSRDPICYFVSDCWQFRCSGSCVQVQEESDCRAKEGQRDSRVSCKRNVYFSARTWDFPSDDDFQDIMFRSDGTLALVFFSLNRTIHYNITIFEYISELLDNSNEVD